MDTHERPCEIRVRLISKLSAASEAHAKHATELSAIAGNRNHAAFRELKKLCAKTQRRFEAARVALAKHRQEHGC